MNVNYNDGRWTHEGCPERHVTSHERLQCMLDEARAELDGLRAEIEQLRRAGKSAMDLYGAAVIEWDDAAGKLAEIKAFCGDVVSGLGRYRSAEAFARDLLAVLDREPAAD